MKSKDSVIVNFFPPSHSTFIWADSWIEPQSCRNKIHQTHHCNYQEMSEVWCTEKTTLKLFRFPWRAMGGPWKGTGTLGDSRFLWWNEFWGRNSWTVWTVAIWFKRPPHTTSVLALQELAERSGVWACKLWYPRKAQHDWYPVISIWQDLQPLRAFANRLQKS